MKWMPGKMVKIKSREWMGTLPADAYGCLFNKDDERGAKIYPEMQQFAGQSAFVLEVDHRGYLLTADAGCHWWGEWALETDPDERENRELQPREAIALMLAGSTLFDSKGNEYRRRGSGFVATAPGTDHVEPVETFTGLFWDRPSSKRPWTTLELLSWASSGDSFGWVVKFRHDNGWSPPQSFQYNYPAGAYQRARIVEGPGGPTLGEPMEFETEEE
jgi:hypothetical protein